MQEIGASAAQESWTLNLRGDDSFTCPRSPDWWTGQAPPGCPGVGQDGCIRALPVPNLAQARRQDLLAYFDNGWTLTEVLFSALRGEEAFYRPPYHSLRHPMIFYYAHPAVLYVNKLRVAGLVSAPINEYFEQLFETGVDEMSWDDLSKNQMRWPSLAEVHEYRKTVYGVISDLIRNHPSVGAPIDMESPLWALAMGFEHERIHLETSSVLMRELPLRLLERPAQWPGHFPVSTETQPQENPWIAVEGGTVTLGKQPDFPSYGWDNEYGQRKLEVASFAASRQLISNHEFLAFMRAGGYQEPRYWSEEGWRWRTYRNAKWPTFWVPKGPAGLYEFDLRLIFECVALPLDWPVTVNYHEAKAYAAWQAELGGQPCRLLTEAEHHRLRAPQERAGGEPGTDFSMRWGGELREPLGKNLALAYGSESAVRSFPATPNGFHDVFGNLWQWCEDHLAALPGFKVHRLYDDFSTPCFDGQHQIIMGGSFISTGDEAGPYARFHFRPHFFQHAGFRLVRPHPGETEPPKSCVDAPPPHVGTGPCCSANPSVAGTLDTDLRDRYLLSHFGSPEEIFATSFRFQAPDTPNHVVRQGRLLIDKLRQFQLDATRALEVGCAVGGASFELAREFAEVVAFDLSPGMLEAARQLQSQGTCEYSVALEGELRQPLVARVDPSIDRARVQFRRADAGALPADLGQFQVVLAANILEHLPSPAALLGRLGGPRGLVHKGGLLLITSSYDWSSHITPRDAWLGGLDASRGLDGLKRHLDAEFELLETCDWPVGQREHARKFELTIAQVSLWRRRP